VYGFLDLSVHLISVHYPFFIRDCYVKVNEYLEVTSLLELRGRISERIVVIKFGNYPARI
jgi:hypothetical protein